MNNEKLVKPTVHLNGTGRKTLAEQFMAAYEGIGVALDKVHDAAPNARDYYPQGNEAFLEARRQHQARIDALRDLQGEFQVLLESVE